jgi:hypothetical protein
VFVEKHLTVGRKVAGLLIGKLLYRMVIAGISWW